ncbi:MAG: transglycosylase domain-containing protein [Actinomycetota bacterium]
MAKRSRRKTPMQRAVALAKRRWWIIAAALVAGTILVVIVSFLAKIPLPDAAPGSQSSKIVAFDGQVVGTLHGDENRTIVPLDKISMNLQNAVISTEDRDFYKHPGISLKGIIRAAFSNVKGGGPEQGGSTLTQQYVRNAFIQVGRQRTIVRKLKEAVVALKIERKFSKKKILEFYLNTVYFGRGAYGAEAAARTYFSKPAADLTVSEAAYMAGIIRAPQTYQPDRNPQGAKRIRDEVLGDMVAAGRLKHEVQVSESGTELAFKNLAKVVGQDSPRAGYFIEYVRRLLLGKRFHIPEKELFGGGLEIHTTLDLKMQDAAEAAVKKVLNKPNDPEAALVAMSPSGEVRAMVGGRNVDDPKAARGFNYAAAAPGQNNGGRFPGSAFKPITLAAWVDQDLSVNSTLSGPPELKIDSKQCRNQDGTPWDVSNFDNESFSQLNVIDATVHSVNTIYAQMMDKIGPRAFVSEAQKLGLDIPRSAFGCALTLGTAPVTPLELARAYSVFAARGRLPETVVITKIVTPDGKVISETKPKSTDSIPPNTADTVNLALQQNINRGTGTGAKLNRPAAGKTGTNQNHIDAWFAGYTPDLVGVVWMGFPPEGNPPKIQEMTNVHGIRVTGGTFPATIWKEFMQVALKGIKASNFTAPTIGGQVLSPSPVPCGSPTPGSTKTVSVTPCPSPSPSPSPSPAPSVGVSTPPKHPPPSPSPSPLCPSPTAASPVPTPKPSPSPSC